jgi:hypothetical protein
MPKHHTSNPLILADPLKKLKKPVRKTFIANETIPVTQRSNRLELKRVSIFNNSTVHTRTRLTLRTKMDYLVLSFPAASRNFDSQLTVDDEYIITV